MRAPITLGLQLPDFNYPGVPPEALFEKVAEIARTAEASGYSTVTVMDHLHQIPGVGPPENYMFEGNVLLGALAARTSKVGLGLLVGGVTYRNPALLAKMTTSLDVISGGRAILGLGAAWFEDEHLAYGFDFPPLRERFERLEDALRIARAMFTQEQATVEGTHHHVRGVLNNPRPLRGDIPIMVGGSGERKTLRLVAQYADACNVFGDAEHARHLMGVLDRHCEEVGRDPAEITRTRLAIVVIGEDDAQAARKYEAVAPHVSELRRSLMLVGGPGRIAEQVAALLDAGIEGLTVSLPDVHDLDVVRLAGETIGPLVATGPASGVR